MTQDEKIAIQSLLVDELANTQKEHPTLLLDVLLSGQGPQWVWRVLSTQHARSSQAAQAFEHLLKAFNGPQQADEAAA